MYPAETLNKTYGQSLYFTCITEPQDEYGVDLVVWELSRQDYRYPKTICSGIEVAVEVRHNKYECRNKQRTHTLIIRDVVFEDAGTYTCTEDAGRGPGSNSSRLFVHSVGRGVNPRGSWRPGPP